MTFSIFFLVCVGIVVAVLKELQRDDKKRNRFKRNSTWTSPNQYNGSQGNSGNYVKKYGNRVGYAEQLDIAHLEEVEFSVKKIMGNEEYNVFKVVENDIIPLFKGCRVFSQVCMGEIIESKNTEAHCCFNSKRIDILIIDYKGLPLVAIEYQGSGHYQGNAPLRDAVKKEVLRKAGVLYLEILKEHTVDNIRYLVKCAVEAALKAKSNGGKNGSN